MKTIVLFVFSLTYILQINAQTKFPKHIDESHRKVSIDYAIKNGMPLCFIDVEVDYDVYSGDH